MQDVLFYTSYPEVDDTTLQFPSVSIEIRKSIQAFISSSAIPTYFS